MSGRWTVPSLDCGETKLVQGPFFLSAGARKQEKGIIPRSALVMEAMLVMAQHERCQ